MATVRIEDNVEITTYTKLTFNRVDGRGGFGFDCDENGMVDSSALNPLAKENYMKCLTGEHDVKCVGVETYTSEVRLCNCGSGEYPEEVYDAHGIYVARVCDKCRKERLKDYRTDIFDDADYETDEQIDEDY